MPDTRDPPSRPIPFRAPAHGDDIATPPEGTHVATSLRAEMFGIREDLRVHSANDQQQLTAINQSLNTSTREIGDMKAETVRQTVMLQHLTAARQKVRDRTWKLIEVAATGVIGAAIGWLVHHFTH
jgi:ElaB/YqjD/DUF883 family membrane-anchored ribosome-binding protein